MTTSSPSNKTSLLYWYPLIKDLDVPMPSTEVAVTKPLSEWMGILDDPIQANELMSKITEAIEKVGYPAFMRTDHYSGKHSFRHACYIESPAEIIPHLINLIDKSCMIDVPINAVVIREFIELDAPFKAFDGLPIARERRYFVQDGQVLVHHPYWPADALQFRPGLVPIDWPVMLEEINQETRDEINILTEYACTISERLEGAWSVDFAKGKDGKWYFIDAAEAWKSWVHKDFEQELFSKIK